MDDIINIDECLSDSFSLSSDTDIRNIVDQWKQGDLGTENKDQKYVDTRTFTRPKKKIYSHSDANNGFGVSRIRMSSGSDALVEETMTSSTSSTDPPTQPQIDLKIGGLVTSLQRSFLGDMSPPPTMLMESSIEPMGNSLITSSDFSNINKFINDNEDSLSLAQFKNYRLSDAISDRNFLERLTNYDDSLFSKDADINNIDGSNLLANTNGGETFSGNSTLQNSTESSSNSGKNDETFVPARSGNATFNASGSASERSRSDGTFVQNNSDSVGNRNGTFDATPSGGNATFDASKTKVMAAMHIDTMDMLDNEQMSLQGSIDDFKCPDGFGNATINLSVNIDEENGSPIRVVNAPKPIPPGAYQSTPARKDFGKKSRRSETLANISPILSEDLKLSRNQMPNVDKFFDVEIDEYPVLLRNTSKSDSRASNPLALMNLREEERQSLKNFEDYENTMLMLENNKNEDEFDDMLNNISSSISKSQKVRQSLDLIKKRHSLINMEKQYHDELSREKNSNGIGNEQPVSERSKMNDSFIKSAMVSSTSSSASSSGERLLRRSRLYDDVIPTSGNQLNTSSFSISSGDNKQTVVENDAATESLNRKNQSHLTRDIEKTDQQSNQYNIEDAPNANVETKANNRDRFKTIRIFKKPPENAVQVPDASASNEKIAMYSGQSVDHFSQKNTNSPQSAAEARAINTMTFKKSALARPKYLGGIQKRDAYTKSSSHEILSNDSYDQEANDVQATKTVPLKSPMGVKSKSVHSLVTSSKMSTGLSRPLAAATTSAHNTGTFKIPKPLTALRQPTAAAAGNRKIGLIRPSSGYYGYNAKRLDSDSESGRFSSNNSLSSGSSKGSLNKPDYESVMNSTFATNSNPNSTFAVAPPVSQMYTPPEPTNGNGGNIPRPSGLRPPTQIRKSGLPRPMTIPKR